MTDNEVVKLSKKEQYKIMIALKYKNDPEFRTKAREQAKQRYIQIKQNRLLAIEKGEPVIRPPYTPAKKQTTDKWRLNNLEKWREGDRNRKITRYANDPEFRKLSLLRSKQSLDRKKQMEENRQFC
jgi:hypothetical protein